MRPNALQGRCNGTLRRSVDGAKSWDAAGAVAPATGHKDIS